MIFPVEISVIMPTYNVSITYLKDAVDSILTQTFRDFEFIIIDDGSTNGIWDYLRNLKDERIRLFRNERNQGVTKTLNTGLKLARGKYIARMDSDDISLPTRFERQYSYMERHPDVILCGTRVEGFGDRHYISGGKWRRKLENMEDYRIHLLFANPGPYHPTVFIRNEMLKRNLITYDETLVCAQDYGLFATVSRFGRVVTLDDVLVQYRIHKNQICIAHKESQFQSDKQIQKKLLCQILGDISQEDLDRHFYFLSGRCAEAKADPWISEWIERILFENARCGIYNQKKLRKHMRLIKRRLVRQSFSEDMAVSEKLALSSQYLNMKDVCRVLVKDALRM